MKGLSPQRQFDILRRGAVQIVPEDEFRRKLEESASAGRPLRVKYGADPSAPDIHLGHTVPLVKLREFQDLGHLVVFIIGDFTAMVGDPTGRSKTRRQLSREEVERNSRTYQEQVFKILDRERTEVVYNSAWLSPLTFADIIELSAKYTVARMLERDDFSKRYRDGKPISVLEFLYPLMQGYDSVAVEADVEIGGTDQTFNLLVAREIQREYGRTPQAILTLPLLEGTDGSQKMSKSLGNYVGIDESPADIYGKIMSISDDLMWRYYRLLSPLPEEDVEGFREACAGGANPMDFKKRLAFEITARFAGAESARSAERRFSRIHQEGLDPERMPEVRLSASEAGEISLLELLVRAGLVSSRSEGRRKLAEGAVGLDGEKLSDPSESPLLKGGEILRLGRRRFVRVAIESDRRREAEGDSAPPEKN
ncbi:MAG TPA: tyrosine--tRNA ligase [bacterium]|nr:tyrosine--tRNA ligase [bacterium]